MSPVIEALESRTMLTSASAAVLQPIFTAGSKWVYKLNQDGRNLSLTDTVLPGRFPIGGTNTTAHQLKKSDGLSTKQFYSHDASGAIRAHVVELRILGKRGSETYSPPILTMPATVRVGATYVSNGSLDLGFGSHHFLGTYKVATKVLREQTVTVPAGVFDCITIQVQSTEIANLESGRLIVKVRQVAWLGRNVGAVKQSVTTTTRNTESGFFQSSSISEVLQSYTIPARGAAALSVVQVAEPTSKATTVRNDFLLAAPEGFDGLGVYNSLF